MDRTASLLGNIDLERSVGLEIGPLSQPIVPRVPGRQIFYADHANKEALQAAGGQDERVTLDAMPTINYVISPLPEALDRKFDYIVASHVIEHVPDLLGFVITLLGWLNPGGALHLAIPDKRYTFDRLRPLSTAGQVLEAYLDQRKRPPFSAIYDTYRFMVDLNLQRAWREETYTGPLNRTIDSMLGRDWALTARRDGAYRDCHCWVFTYASFLALVAELNEAALAPAISIVRQAAPIHGANEFHISLAPGPERPATAVQ